MIPLQLTLKNFLSYREASLDFRGLHTACICGPNGAGKSSLLEAITWAIWGKSRASSDDDAINAGADSVRVDFLFRSNGENYLIIRSRTRGKSVDLQFQIETESGRFRTLTEKGVRSTQEKINQTLKLDYDTFINSAYLRQGRADEFMLKGPKDRKQILADLLKLDHYEELAKRAKDRSKEYEGQCQQLQQNLAANLEEFEHQDGLAQKQQQIAADLDRLNRSQSEEQKKLEALQGEAANRKTWEDNLIWQQNQDRNLDQDGRRLRGDRDQVKARLNALNQFLERAPEINSNYQQLLRWREEEKILAQNFQVDRQGREQKQLLERQLEQQRHNLNLKISQTQTQIENLEQRERELQELLAQEEEIKARMGEYQASRQRLQALEALKLQVTPLQREKDNLQREIERARAQFEARLQEREGTLKKIRRDLENINQLRPEYLSTSQRLTELEKKKVYKDRVQQKGQQQKIDQEGITKTRANYEKELRAVEQKKELLQTQEAVCPLCDRPLSEHDRHHVIAKIDHEQEKIELEMGRLREQLASSEQELKALRLEYSQLDKELKDYEPLSKRQTELGTRLAQGDDLEERLEEVTEEIEHIKQSLVAGDYAKDLLTRLKDLEEQIANLGYDDQTYGLVRGQVDNLRSAEYRLKQWEEAQRKQGEILQEKPRLQQQLIEERGKLDRLGRDSELQGQIEAIEAHLLKVGYDRARHDQIAASIRQAQKWEVEINKLQQTQQELPQAQERLEQIEVRLQENVGQLTKIRADIKDLQEKIATLPDYSQEIRALDLRIQQRRQQLASMNTELGKVQQQLTHLQQRRESYERSRRELFSIRQKVHVYKELADAFGKNGIQALTIENLLPQLEAETNLILSRLTGNQLHVQFITQKTTKGTARAKNPKVSDTLDIHIADTRGTRAYETYSGGEAFRINFSIRLALAKILALRSGAALQLLIVDEGFGTQDGEGCDRLIAAINAISDDFACILTVTHIPQFKEAFQTRIEVRKSQDGSEIMVSN